MLCNAEEAFSSRNLKSKIVQAHHSSYTAKYTERTFFFKFGKHEVDSSQSFCSQDSFKLLKLIKNLQRLLFIWVKSIFAIGEIKIEMLKLFINSLNKNKPITC